MAFKLPLEPELQRRIARQRLNEFTRKQRIFDYKQLKFGYNKQDRDDQREDARFRKEMEEKRDKEFLDEMTRQNRELDLKEKAHRDEMRQLARDIDRFRLTEQRPRHGKDFDLENPYRAHKKKPERIGGDDPRCTVSGLQQLVGEDLGYEERKRCMQAQYRSMITTQMQDNELRKLREEQELHLEHQALLAQDEHLVLMAKQAKEKERSMRKRDEKYNQWLAEDKIAEMGGDKAEFDFDSMKDQLTHQMSNFLFEDPNAARSSFGPHRVVQDRYKGATREQNQQNQQELLRQIAEKSKQKEKEKAAQHEFDKGRWREEREWSLRHRHETRETTKTNKQWVRDNHELAEAQRIQKKELEDSLNSNPISDDFYSQFSASSY